jgi:short-subunit dehydrogenase
MNVLVTGAAKGLGAYLIGRFAENPENNTIGIDIFKQEDIHPEIIECTTQYYQFDLRNYYNLPILINTILDEFGTIDLCVNNAGLKTFGDLSTLKDSIIYDTIFVNYVAPIIIIKSLLEKLKKHDAGAMIINISSNAGFRGYKKGTAYCSSKAGLNIFTEALNQELPRDGQIKVYNLCPSTIYTGELKAKYPLADPKNYILPKQIYDAIIRILENPPKTHIVPIISFRETIKYVIYDLKRHLFWLRKTLLNGK